MRRCCACQALNKLSQLRLLGHFHCVAVWHGRYVDLHGCLLLFDFRLCTANSLLASDFSCEGSARPRHFWDWMGEKLFLKNSLAATELEVNSGASRSGWGLTSKYVRHTLCLLWLAAALVNGVPRMSHRVMCKLCSTTWPFVLFRYPWLDRTRPRMMSMHGYCR